MNMMTLSLRDSANRRPFSVAATPSAVLTHPNSYPGQDTMSNSLLPTRNADGIAVIPMTSERPLSLSGRESELWESYACPAGSAVIFTEALCHTGTEWTNTRRDRLTLFTCYNTVKAKWGKRCIPDEVVAAMPPLRQTLLRGVWHGMGEVPGVNRYYDEANQAV